MILVDGTCWLDESYTIAAAVVLAKVRAGRGTFDGRDPAGLMGKRYAHVPTGTVFTYARDVGMHSSGWWKNPDYERCRHLSLSFRNLPNGEIAPRDVKRTKEWVCAFFGDDRRKLWCEPPYSSTGKKLDVWHYRLFCAPDWSPLMPRGEVYTRAFTEKGWKSYSDVRAELEDAEERAMEETA